MIKIKLYNFKNSDVVEFECIQYEIEKGYYKFYISSTEIKYCPSYDFILDAIYPYELKLNGNLPN